MLNRRHLFMAALAAAPALAAGDAFAQQAIVGISTTTTSTAEGRIAAADPAARTVTLTMSDGSSRTFKVSPAVANLGSAKVGDTVRVGVEEKRTFVLSGPNIKTPSDRNTSVAAVGRMGNTVGAVAADKSITTWWVTAVDPAGNTISLVDPGGGQVRTFAVDSSAGRANLPRVKPGDRLTAISTDIVAVSLTPKS
jgi:protein involved in polysaccharide export with SLBB domain